MRILLCQKICHSLLLLSVASGTVSSQQIYSKLHMKVSRYFFVSKPRYLSSACPASTFDVIIIEKNLSLPDCKALKVRLGSTWWTSRFQTKIFPILYNRKIFKVMFYRLSEKFMLLCRGLWDNFMKTNKQNLWLPLCIVISRTKCGFENHTYSE